MLWIETWRQSPHGDGDDSEETGPGEQEASTGLQARNLPPYEGFLGPLRLTHTPTRLVQRRATEGDDGALVDEARSRSLSLNTQSAPGSNCLSGKGKRGRVGDVPRLFRTGYQDRAGCRIKFGAP